MVTLNVIKQESGVQLFNVSDGTIDVVLTNRALNYANTFIFELKLVDFTGN